MLNTRSETDTTVSKIIQANDANFNSILDDAGVIIVDFWSPGCVPCKQIEPVLEDIAAAYSNQVKVIKVNVNESPRLVTRFRIRGLPTLAFIMKLEVRRQVVGLVDRMNIIRTLNEILDDDKDGVKK